ncbi:MAG: ATP-binding protein [Rhodohalobacter sp.]|nr:ATP-binding protein [Rhodohalobacter sp.]
MGKEPENPFVLSGYYGRKWFCNRDKELNELTRHIKSDRNVVLYAWRRLGKTAIIKQLFSDFEESGEYECVYADLMVTQSMPEATEAITKAVFNRFGKTSSGISSSIQRLLSKVGVSLRFNEASGVPEIFFGLQRPKSEKQSFDALGDFLSNRKKRVVIALDEFQQVTSYENVNAEVVFRNWMQEFPDIRFIYSGSHRSLMTSMFSDKSRPFYKSSQLLPLEPITEEDYREFIVNHFSENEKTIDSATITELYEWARGQTYTVQRICNYLFDYYEEATVEKLQVVFDKLIDQDKPMFASFQKMLTKVQWKVLKSIAKEEPLENPLGNEFIQKYALGASSSVQVALKSLQKKEIVIKEGDKFLVHDVILARWLQTL